MYEELRLSIVAEETAVYHTYKDRVFRILFKEKKRLLEHQSSFCPNMALRGFLYFADLYKKYVKDVDLSIRKKIMIPAPQYIVFYNGLERKEEEFTQKLSDSFEDGKEGCIELTVRTININYGQNKALMEKCKTLAGYSFFVAQVRKNLETMKLEKAVEEAINTCIEKDILKDFFLDQKAEVMAMSIYEYNEEYVKKSLYEEGLEEGIKEGIKEGEKVGILKNLAKNVEVAMRNFHISLKEACEGLGTTVEEYEKAKNFLS